ncbi:MAG: hypothetical protein JKY94_17450 [Rhodobacteraceae bacterium]|nr:hypothetical protein [Paracoccaceae bacterium]
MSISNNNKRNHNNKRNRNKEDNAMGIFDGIKGAKASNDSNYITPGDYYLQIDRVKEGETRAKVPFVVFEMTVLFVNKEAANEDGQRVSNEAGESVSWLLMSGNDMFLPNLKTAIMALMGCAEADVDKESCEQLTSDKQPFAGMITRIKAREITTKAGNPFTKVSFHPAWKKDFVATKTTIPEHARFADTVPGYADRAAKK